MIASLNSDCSVLTLANDLFANETVTIDSVMLRSRLNCSLTESTVDVSSLIESISNGQISIPATVFYNASTSTTYCDGIYYFQLDIEYTQSSNTYLATSSQCILIDCDLKCKVLDYYTKTKDSLAWQYYYALTIGGDCDSCYCTEMCSLYTELKLLINDNHTTSQSAGCGCS